eukprot:CAMPEP_0196656620 /NCGR_PEP_ID=MMETSP1086-20130531/18904_1 /TAXON_ID=77921 /ORGANISM="Cyanoptyche  gloeocystis , Strain SAG4.97" /LENGTH=121 /DNA_ID=CAMNT_0041989451 /DNA_START=54 /DNA_END=419 /DNA_ORIENTATION=+
MSGKTILFPAIAEFAVPGIIEQVTTTQLEGSKTFDGVTAYSVELDHDTSVVEELKNVYGCDEFFTDFDIITDDVPCGYADPEDRIDSEVAVFEDGTIGGDFQECEPSLLTEVCGLAEMSLL